MELHKLLAASATLFCSAAAFAQTTVTMTLNNGNDALRGGNHAYLQVVLLDGRVTTEQLLSSGMDDRSTVRIETLFPDDTFDLDQISALRIRHDGAPRPGHPFDTPDHWDLARVRIDGHYDSWGDPAFGSFVARFGPELTRLTIHVRAPAAAFDLRVGSVTYLAGTGFAVNVQNIGAAAGRLVSVACRTSTRVEGLAFTPGRPMESGSSQSFVVPLRAVGSIRGSRYRAVTCSAEGRQFDGAPEVATVNNRLTIWVRVR